MEQGAQIVIEEPDLLAMRFEELVRSVILRVPEQRRVRLALSGGSAATCLLPGLIGLGKLSDRLEIFFCDERAVPLDDEQSNFRSAQSLWFRPAGLSHGQLYPMVSSGNLDEMKQRYEALLRERSEGAALDLALLGVGPDGHIASLFPGSSALESPNWVEAIDDSPKPPPQRLSLTLSLLSAVPCVVAAFGESKATVVKRAISGDTRLPLGRLLRQNRSVQLWLDKGAASQLEGSETIAFGR